MARGTPIITSFTGGEVSDLTDGRLDQEGYYACLSKLQNMVVTVQGPATKRTGTRFVRATKTQSKRAWLIPFEYASGDNYILEFGEEYIRFYTQQGCVLSGGSPLEVVTPYQEEDLANIRFAQVGDVLFMVHPIYPPKQLTRTAATTWVFASIPFVWGPFRDDDERGITVTPSAVTGVGITLTASASLWTADHVGSEVLLTGEQAASASLTGAGQSTGALALSAGESLIVSISGTWAGTIYLERTYDGSTWLQYILYTANATYEMAQLEDGVQYRLTAATLSSGSAAARVSIKDKKGYAKITAITNATVAVATVIETLPGTQAFAKWAESAFSEVYGYPGAIRMYEQRMLLAGTIDEPNKIYGSQVDDYPNFERGSTDSDAYAYTLAGSRVNPILWMCDRKVLFVGTLGDEWRFGKAEEPTTPNAVDAKTETANGSEPIQALLVENSVVFVEAGGRHLHAITYDLDSDSYQAPRISEHAPHLLKDGIIHAVFQQQPRPVLWMVTATGKLIGCTYSRAMKLAAFHQHTLGGTDAKVEAAAVIRSADRDELWLIVSRTIGGATVRYVEFFEDENYASLDDAFYVDCGLSYSGAAASSFSGLGHLEGETVKVVADGAVHAPRVVTSGAITLERPASSVIAGLGYKAVLKTKRMELKGGSGTSQGKPKQIYQVTVRLFETVTCDVGYDEASVKPIFFRTTTTPLGSPPALFSGDKIVSMPDRGTRDGYICISSDSPAPLTVSAIVPTMYASEL